MLKWLLPQGSFYTTKVVAVVVNHKFSYNYGFFIHTCLVRMVVFVYDGLVGLLNHNRSIIGLGL